MNINKLSIECVSCDKYFILAFSGDDYPVCCPFCSAELEQPKLPEEDYSDDESLLDDDKPFYESEVIYNDEDSFMD